MKWLIVASVHGAMSVCPPICPMSLSKEENRCFACQEFVISVLKVISWVLINSNQKIRVSIYLNDSSLCQFHLLKTDNRVASGPSLCRCHSVMGGVFVSLISPDMLIRLNGLTNNGNSFFLSFQIATSQDPRNNIVRKRTSRFQFSGYGDDA